MAEPGTETIFCLLRMTDAAGTTTYDASGIGVDAPLAQADRDALEIHGKAALGLPSYVQANRDLLEQIMRAQQRIVLLEHALTDAGVAVPA